MPSLFFLVGATLTQIFLTSVKTTPKTLAQPANVSVSLVKFCPCVKPYSHMDTVTSGSCLVSQQSDLQVTEQVSSSSLGENMLIFFPAESKM